MKRITSNILIWLILLAHIANAATDCTTLLLGPKMESLKQTLLKQFAAFEGHAEELSNQQLALVSRLAHKYKKSEEDIAALIKNEWSPSEDGIDFFVETLDLAFAAGKTHSEVNQIFQGIIASAGKWDHETLSASRHPHLKPYGINAKEAKEIYQLSIRSKIPLEQVITDFKKLQYHRYYWATEMLMMLETSYMFDMEPSVIKVLTVKIYEDLHKDYILGFDCAVLIQRASVLFKKSPQTIFFDIQAIIMTKLPGAISVNQAIDQLTLKYSSQLH